MHRRTMWIAVALMLLATFAVTQAQESHQDYLDIYTVQVKPEKRADFDAIAKKMVTANRQNKGDTWLAMETSYGPGDRVTFVSTRHSYKEAEEGMNAFYQALQKGFGKPGMGKALQEFNQCITSSHSEFRRRRWDLTSNAPSDAASYAKLVGTSRWLRTTVVHVKPGQITNFEAEVKELKAATERSAPSATILVSQAVAGQEGTVFYFTMLQNSLGAYDSVPTTHQILGDEGYEKFLRASADTVSGTETVINRFLPDLSNATEEIASVAPDYWRPKAAATNTNARTNAGKASVVNAGAKNKMEDNTKQ